MGGEEVKEQVQKIDEAVEADGITAQELVDVTAAKNFLESKNDPKKDKEKIDKIIEDNKSKIVTGISDFFKANPPQDTPDQAKINSLNTEQITAYINLIDWTKDKSLKSIRDALDAKSKTTEAEKNIDYLLNLEETPENTTIFFETCKQEEYNAAFDRVFGKTTKTPLSLEKATKTTANNDQQNFIRLLQAYSNKSYPDKEISDIKIGIAGTGSPKFHQEYEKNKTRTTEFSITKEITGVKDKKQNINGFDFYKVGNDIFINKDDKEYKYDASTKGFNSMIAPAEELQSWKDQKETGNLTIDNGQLKIKKVVIRGTQEQMQSERVLNTEIKKDEVGDKKVDRTSEANGINAFDDVGNYKAFNEYLNKQNGDTKTIEANMKTITDQIINYKPTPGKSDAGEDLNSLKNGYCKVLMEYIIKNKGNEALKKSYIDKIEKGDTSLLGTDDATRLVNYRALNAAGVSINLATIEDKYKGKGAIEAGTDMLKQGFKMILDLLTSMGLISKATLKTWGIPPKSIDDYFSTKYEIPTDKMEVIKKVSEGQKGQTGDTADKFVTQTYIDNFEKNIKDGKNVDVKLMETLLIQAGKEPADYILTTGDTKTIKPNKQKDILTDVLKNDTVKADLQKKITDRHKAADAGIKEENAIEGTAAADMKEMEPLNATNYAKILTIYLTDFGVKKDMNYVVAENFDKPMTAPVETIDPAKIADNIGVEYTDGVYTYENYKGEPKPLNVKNDNIKLSENDIKLQKEQEIKNDLTAINNEAPLVQKSFEHIFLKDEKGPTAYSVLADDLNNTTKSYDKILTKDNISKFLTELQKNDKATIKIFNFAAGEGATALANIAKMNNSFKAEKDDTTGNIKISGKETADAAATTLSFVLKPNLANFKV